MARHKRYGPDFEELVNRATLATDEQLPRFTYTLSPNSAPISAPASTVLTLTNPSTAFPVAVSVGDLIAVAGWSGITQAPKSIAPVPPADSDWGAIMTDSSLGTILKLFVTDDIEVAPLASYAFTLNNILIDNEKGSVQLPVTEIIGGVQTKPPALAFGKLGTEPQIFAWSDQNSVGLGESTNINWTIVLGQYVTVIPPDDGTQYPRVGTAPYTGQTARMPLQNAPQTTFTVTLWQQSATPIPFPVSVLLSPPVISRFDPQSLPPIAIDDTVTLSWSVAYSPEVTLQPTKSSKYVANEGTRAVRPRDFLAPNDSKVVFVLSAAGYLGPKTKTLTVKFQPERIAYFRYPSFDQKNGYTVSTPNALSAPVTQLGPTHFSLTATGPGGPLTQELGGTGLEIQVIVADPALPASGQETKLKYLVQNAATLKLLPGNIPLTFGADGRGETTVTPSGTTTYTLVATDANNKSVSSEITIQTRALKETRRRTTPTRGRKK